MPIINPATVRAGFAAAQKLAGAIPTETKEKIAKAVIDVTVDALSSKLSQKMGSLSGLSRKQAGPAFGTSPSPGRVSISNLANAFSKLRNTGGEPAALPGQSLPHGHGTSAGGRFNQAHQAPSGFLRPTAWASASEPGIGHPAPGERYHTSYASSPNGAGPAPTERERRPYAGTLNGTRPAATETPQMPTGEAGGTSSSSPWHDGGTPPESSESAATSRPNASAIPTEHGMSGETKPTDSAGRTAG